MVKKTYRANKPARGTVKSSRYSLLWKVAAGVVLLAIVLAVLELTNTTHLLHKPQAATAEIPSTTSTGGSATTQSSSKQDTGAASSSGSAMSPASSTPTSAKLIAPWGNFVSNHRPGQNGAPTTETSACNTTPGATCYIRFTNGDLTRNLDAKVADSNGSVIWNWDVAKSDFSPGSWKVTVVASLNDQTLTASDSQPLEIQ